jgi:hypothetical protein
MPNDPEGAPRPVADPVSKALEQLVDAEPGCLYCRDPITYYDMIVGWPAADVVVAHFGCYAKAQNLVTNTARGEVLS